MIPYSYICTVSKTSVIKKIFNKVIQIDGNNCRLSQIKICCLVSYCIQASYQIRALQLQLNQKYQGTGYTTSDYISYPD